MAIFGNITLEDTRIEFEVLDDTTAQYQICDLLTDACEHLKCDGKSFMSALAIAVHWDGMPNYNTDYAMAEAIQRKIRWIP